MQTLIAYFVVAIAMVYAAWLFMPQALRRRLIARFISFVPSSQQARFSRLQSGAESVGCSSCKGCASTASSSAPQAAQTKTIQLHRR